MFKKLATGLVIATLCGAPAVALGGTGSGSGTKVSASKHPNLAAAQKLMSLAIKKLTTAQQKNEYELGGHGAKAKELLEQAYEEAKKAAEAANAASK